MDSFKIIIKLSNALNETIKSVDVVTVVDENASNIYVSHKISNYFSLDIIQKRNIKLANETFVEVDYAGALKIEYSNHYHVGGAIVLDNISMSQIIPNESNVDCIISKTIYDFLNSEIIKLPSLRTIK